jgi:hypothetical protein
MTDDLAQAMHDAIRGLLTWLATGADEYDATIPARHMMLRLPEIQTLSDAADDWQRAQTEESR